jgi:hypothetical protein
MTHPGRTYRRPAAAARVLAAAGVALTAAACSQVAPLRVVPPTPGRLGTPIIVRAMHQPSPPDAGTGRCPAGFVAPGMPLADGFSAKAVSPSAARSSGPPTASQGPPSNECFRVLGAPVTITSAAVFPISTFHPPTPPGGAPPPPVEYGVQIGLTAAGAREVAAVTTTAYHAQANLDISVSGRTYVLTNAPQPFTNFQIFLRSRGQAERFRRLLLRSS